MRTAAGVAAIVSARALVVEATRRSRAPRSPTCGCLNESDVLGDSDADIPELRAFLESYFPVPGVFER